MIELRQIRHVVALAASGSYVAAARAVALTQPALTRSIQAVEARYGVQLFDRGRNGVVPTDAGHEFIARAHTLLHEAQMLDQSMVEQREGVAGEVRFGLGPLIASATLHALVPAVTADYPKIALRISVAGGAALIDQLATNAIQFAICSSAVVPAEPFRKSVLGRLPLGVVVRAGHPLAGRRVSLAETLDFPQIGGSGDERERSVAQHYRPHVSCDNYEILRSLTRDSNYLWITSPAVVATELADGSMVCLDCPQLLDESYDVVLVTRRRGAMSRAARTITERLTAVLAPTFTAEATS